MNGNTLYYSITVPFHETIKTELPSYKTGATTVSYAFQELDVMFATFLKVYFKLGLLIKSYRQFLKRLT